LFFRDGGMRAMRPANPFDEDFILAYEVKIYEVLEAGPKSETEKEKLRIKGLIFLRQHDRDNALGD
jgi:hypothetical protein